jgi:hypothetical protein
MDAETPVPPVTHAPHPAYHPHMFKAEALLINLRKALAKVGRRSRPSMRWRRTSTTCTRTSPVRT